MQQLSLESGPFLLPFLILVHRLVGTKVLLDLAAMLVSDSTRLG